jgi:transcriptional regulator with XRE-family HTH domain
MNTSGKPADTEHAASVGRRLRELREERGVTREVAGEELGLSPASIARWERSGGIKSDALIRYLHRWGANLNWLFGQPGEKLLSPESGQTIAVPHALEDGSAVTLHIPSRMVASHPHLSAVRVECPNVSEAVREGDLAIVGPPTDTTLPENARGALYLIRQHERLSVRRVAYAGENKIHTTDAIGQTQQLYPADTWLKEMQVVGQVIGLIRLDALSA